MEKALEEGIRFAEGLTPLAIEVDERGARDARCRCRSQHTDGDGVWHETARDASRAHDPHRRRARSPTPCSRARTRRTSASTASISASLDDEGKPVNAVRGLAKPAQPAVLTDVLPDGRSISFFGDLHPSFFGNVVKAMASAKQGYPDRVAHAGEGCAARRARRTHEFFARLDNGIARDGRARRAPDADDRRGVVRAPAAARRFPPGQFYRLQNYETLARDAGGHAARDGRARADRRVGRPRAGTGLDDRARNGRLVRPVRASLQPGEPVVLMGPTGTPTEIEPGETVVLVGGGLGNAVLFSIGAGVRAAPARSVLYFAGYKKMIDRYKVAEIEAAADVVVWCCDEGPGFTPDRPQDRAFVGNIVQAMRAYASGALGRRSRFRSPRATASSPSAPTG